MDPNTRALIMGAAGAGGEKIYVEDVFSTWLYTGNNSTQTITNGIDLAGKGGLVITQARSAASGAFWQDTANGVNKYLTSASTASVVSGAGLGVTNFGATGFSLESNLNSSGSTYASWTFRKQAKFFDVVTWTGDGGASRTLAHSLGTAPGCIIVKASGSAAKNEWYVYHRSLGVRNFIKLNSTAASAGDTYAFTSVTTTNFTITTDLAASSVGGNEASVTYVAYLFAHDAGGFGDSGNDSVVKCGSATGGTYVDLGWEPQWILVKGTSLSTNWEIYDTMRGAPVGGNDAILNANATAAETSANTVEISATGFTLTSAYWSNFSLVYIAIRRGPMKTPTDATKVFQAKLYTGTNLDNRLVTTDIVTDMAWVRQRNDAVLGGMVVGDRLRGQPYSLTGTTAAEVNDLDSFDQELIGGVEYGTAFSSMTGFWVGNDATSKLNADTTSNNHLAYAFRRAPGFFDVVAYAGTGVARTVSHNLGVTPELMIVKHRSNPIDWRVYSAALGSANYLAFNTSDGSASASSVWNSTSPTSSVFSVGTAQNTNSSGVNYIAYLFASCPGVSKVGSYTGTGTTLDVDCGFTNGARFVLIKRTDTTGDWYVWDTARGIIAANDPYLRLNLASAENSSNDNIDPLSSGFQISSTAPAAINANGGSFIYLAIA